MVTDPTSPAPDAAGQENQPTFSIQRIYLKDMSLEQPNSPQIFLEQGQHDVQMQLKLDTTVLSADAVYEVCITSTVQAKHGEKTVFLAEIKYAGIFEIHGLPVERLNPVLGITCPHILYPYVRAQISDTVVKAGFPPIHLQEINFQAMYEQSMAQRVAQEGGANPA